MAGQVSAIRETVLSSFAGPLPHPEQYAQYEAVLPGAAERILRIHERKTEMAEAQMKHRQKMESQVIRSRVVAEITGQWMGFVLGAGLLSTGAWLIHGGKSIEGLTSIGVTIAALIWSGVVGKRKQREELEAKRAAV